MSNFSAARKMIGMALFSAILCMFVQFSFFFLMRSFSTEVKGYDVYSVTSENPTGTYEGYIDKSERPETPEEDKRYLSVLTDMPKSAKIVETVLSTVCSLGILFCTVGTVLANTAAKDRNLGDFDGAVLDKSRGFKLGLMASVPSLAFYVAALILRYLPSTKAADWFFWGYRFIALGPVKPVNDLLVGAETNLASVPWWWVIASGLYVVLFIAFCGAMYLICYNEDSWVAKMLYKSAKKETNVRRLGRR